MYLFIKFIYENVYNFNVFNGGREMDKLEFGFGMWLIESDGGDVVV